MIKKIKELSFKNKCLIFTFIFFLIIFCLTPLTGDDWGNYLVGKKDIGYSFKTAIDYYNTWEGRIVSRFFINVLTYHKWLFNIITALLITGLINCIYQFYDKKTNNIFYLLPIMGILLVNYITFGQCYLWVAGSITYLYPSILVIMCITYIFNKKNNKYSIFEHIILIITSIMIPMFVENIGCAYVSLLFMIMLLDMYKNKKISLTYLCLFVLSSISLILMLKSPGSQIRMNIDSDFNNLSLLSKINYNLSNLNDYMFNRNIFMLIIMLIPINYVLYKKFNKKIINILFNIIPLLTIIQNIRYMIPANLAKYINFYDGIFLTTKNYFLIYYIFLMLMFIYSVFYIVKDENKRYNLIIMLFGSIISMLVMLMTPVWGERVSLFYLFIILIISIFLITIIFNNKKIKYLKILLILLSAYYLGLASYNMLFDINRNKHINSNDNEITIYSNPIILLWNYTPSEDYHMSSFKKYYNLKNKKIKIKKLEVSEILTYLEGKM